MEAEIKRLNELVAELSRAIIVLIAGYPAAAKEIVEKVSQEIDIDNNA